MLSALDSAAIVILCALVLIYVVTIVKDAAEYDKIDPMPVPPEDDGKAGA